MAIKTTYIKCTRDDKTSTFDGSILTKGNLTFGNAVVDSFVIKGRLSTSTVAGASLTLDSTYSYSELVELRCKVTNWTGTGNSFKGYYLRAEAGIGNASGGIRGAEIYGVSNITSGSTGLNQVCGAYITAYTKATAGTFSISYIYGIEANCGLEANSGTLTVGSQASCLYATLQTAGGMTPYTKMHGIIIEAGDQDASRIYGSAILIQNPSWDVTGSTTWTCGIKITEACTTVIDIDTTCTRGIRLGTHDWGVGSTGITLSATDPLMQVAGKITTDTADGMYACSYNQLALTVTQTHGISLAASWNELYITGETIDLTGTANYSGCWGHVEISGTVTTSTGNISGLNGTIIIPATLTNNGTIAGLQIDMILNNGYTNNGIISAIQVGEHTDPGQNKIPYGLNFDAGSIACFARFPDDTVVADADGTLGNAAGFILVNIGGNDYKLQTYATG